MSQTIDTNIKTNWGQFGVLISVFFFLVICSSQ